MKCLLVVLALFGLFAATTPAFASTSPSHKPHKVKKHKAVKHNT